MSENEVMTRAQEIAEAVFSRAGRKTKVSLSSVNVERQGNFTFVTVQGKMGRKNIQSFGVAKCNTSDAFNFEAGVNIATQRAIRKVL